MYKNIPHAFFHDPFFKNKFLQMKRASIFFGVLSSSCAAGAVVQYHNTCIVQTNISLLEHELRNPKFTDLPMRSLVKKELFKQRLYEGKLLHLTPPPDVDVISLTTIGRLR